MPQNRLIYIAILLSALGLLSSALYTLHQVRLSGETIPTRDTFELAETPQQRDLSDRLNKLEDAYEKGDRREVFVLEQKLPEVPETALFQEFQEFQSASSLARKMD